MTQFILNYKFIILEIFKSLLLYLYLSLFLFSLLLIFLNKNFCIIYKNLQYEFFINLFFIIYGFITICIFLFFIIAFNNKLNFLFSIETNNFLFELINIKNKIIIYKNTELFSILLIFLANFIGSISKNTIETRLKIEFLPYLILINYFNLIITYFVYTNNIIIFFILYECLLIPSFFIIYFLSYSQKSIQASIYFLIWTQLGSLLVFISFIFFIKIFKIETFSYLNIYFLSKTTIHLFIYWLSFIFLFFGFGTKIPLIFFQYWILKTHVEAPGGFSIYLSGFLVKTAIFGLYKFIFFFPNIFLNYSLLPIYFIIFFAILDSSIKFWFQSDIKKLIAYCTIQEMNFIIFFFFLGYNKNLLLIGILFIFTHAILSTLLFFLVELIYYRYQSRNINLISGILINNLNLGNAILIMLLLFIGFPGTLKFIIEFIFLFSFIDELLYTTLMFILFNIIASTGFFKQWLNIIFGNIKYLSKNRIFLDLNIKEAAIVLILILIQILPVFFIGTYFLI